MNNSQFHIIAKGPKPWEKPARQKGFISNRPGKQVVKDALPGRNEPCPCQSGLKYKKCHGGLS